MSAMYWVRNDLRTTDNQALTAFLEQNKLGIICWAPDPSYFRADNNRKPFIDISVDSFLSGFQNTDYKIIKLKNVIESNIDELVKLYKINSVFFTSGFAVEEIRTEKFIQSFFAEKNLETFCFDQQTLIDTSQLPFDIQDLPITFTEFRKKIEKKLVIKNTLNQENIKCGAAELNALQHLQDYVWEGQHIKHYKETRNGLLNYSDSSRVSKWISLGIISPRTVYAQIKIFESQIISNESTYWLFFELLWRDYMKIHSLVVGAGLFYNEYSEYENISKINKASLHSHIFENWCNGQTASKFVNANMNELNETGWMTNRGRQNVASYLIYDLKLPWQWGAQYFEKKLIDYDVDLNWGNWLYISGQGFNKQKRRFDTEKQAEMYDPEGIYQKKWPSKYETRIV